MGNGKSKQTTFNNVLDSDSGSSEYERVFDREGHKLLADILEKSFSESTSIDSSLVDELSKQGISVSFGSSDFLPKELSDILGNYKLTLADVKEVHSKHNLVLAVMDYMSDPSKFSPKESKVIEAFMSLNFKQSMALQKVITDNKKGESDIYHGLNANSEDGHILNQMVNSSLHNISLLNTLYTSHGNEGIKNISIVGLIKNAEKIAGSYDYGISSIKLGTHSFYSLIQYGGKNDRGWSTASTTPTLSSVHEYGHHIGMSLGLSSKIGKGKKAVSIYGNTNEEEAFAEAFVVYCLGTEPSYGKAYYKEFCSTMKSKGLDYFKGCLTK